MPQFEVVIYLTDGTIEEFRCTYIYHYDPALLLSNEDETQGTYIPWVHIRLMRYKALKSEG